MYISGDELEYSYVEGIYSSRFEAEMHGKAEEEYRKGKFEMKIRERLLNHPNQFKYVNDEELKNSLKMERKKYSK